MSLFPVRVNALRWALLCPVAALACQAKADCFDDAGQRYQIDHRMLRLLAKGESNFNPAAVHVNSDKSVDMGVMQVNSTHLAWLKQFNITERTLFDKPCVNIAVGAYIFAGFVKQYGYTWRAVGAYGAGSRPDREAARRTYVAHVKRNYAKMFGEVQQGRRDGVRATLPGSAFALADSTVARTSTQVSSRMQVME